MKYIILAAGCFWGVQSYFKLVKGVILTRVGYIQGNKQFPSYEEVKAGQTGHAEACFIKYDDNLTNLHILLEHFFSIVDNKSESEDRFRNAIFYIENEEKNTIYEFIEKKNRQKYYKTVLLEVNLANEFWDAEDYHQDYLDRNYDGYCHISKEKFSFCNKIDENIKKYLK